MKISSLVSKKVRFEKFALLIVLCFSTNFVFCQSLSEDELELYQLIMEYRTENGLSKIPLSKSLTYVAQTHVKDLKINKPDQGDCNSHSWSSKGPWSPCCYTDDHANANGMWRKPRELTSYKNNGYEIACGSSNPIYDQGDITPEAALERWQNSSAHNAVILNQGIWKDTWKAIGIGIYGNFAVVWFGKEIDK